MLEKLEKLSMLPGVSGDEKAVREYILDSVSLLADSYSVDACGNILAFKKGNQRPKKKLMLSAHMDEVGLIITRVREDGLLCFEPVGGIITSVLCGRCVLIGKNRLPGVIGLVPVHLISHEQAGTCPDVKDLCIDIGASSREQALEHVIPGDRCIFDTQFEQMGDGMLKGKAIDDRAGCAVLLDLMNGELEYDTWFAFVTMEEVGLRGAGCAAFTIDPDAAIVIEATTAADFSGVDEDNRVCCLGKGAVVGFMDRSTIYDSGLYRLAMRLARELSIPAQIKQAVAGGNDSGIIHRTRGGIRTIALSVPCRYLHSPASLIAQSDLYAVRDLASALARAIPGEEAE